MVTNATGIVCVCDSIRWVLSFWITDRNIQVWRFLPRSGEKKNTPPGPRVWFSVSCATVSRLLASARTGRVVVRGCFPPPQHTHFHLCPFRSYLLISFGRKKQQHLIHTSVDTYKRKLFSCTYIHHCERRRESIVIVLSILVAGVWRTTIYYMTEWRYTHRDSTKKKKGREKAAFKIVFFFLLWLCAWVCVGEAVCAHTMMNHEEIGRGDFVLLDEISPDSFIHNLRIRWYFLTYLQRQMLTNRTSDFDGWESRWRNLSGGERQLLAGRAVFWCRKLFGFVSHENGCSMGEYLIVLLFVFLVPIWLELPRSVSRVFEMTNPRDFWNLRKERENPYPPKKQTWPP